MYKTYVPTIQSGEFEDYLWDCASSIRYWAQAEVGEKSLAIRVIGDGEGADELFDRRYSVGRTALQKAAELIVSGKTNVNDLIRRYIVQDDQDAWAMDAIVQIAIFGELIYG